MITPRPSARAILDTPAAYSYRRDPAVPKFSDDRPIIIFDGYCALCSGWAQFVLRHDRRAVYRLLRAQSPLGRSLYVHYGLDPEDYQTNILLADGIAWFESEGSIRMAEGLGWPWSLAGCMRILPRPVRDRLYAFVARNRLRFFGRRATCYVPNAGGMTPLRTDGRVPLYRRVLGEAWDSLPAPLQTMHDVQSERTADGVAVVERGSGLLARLVAFVIGFPPAGTDIPITVSFRARQGREYWQRNFAGHAFSSVQEQGRGRFERLLWERFGPLNFVMALVCESERLRFVIRRWSVCGIPLPRALAPRGDSYEFVEAGRFHFHVEIDHPFTGLIVRYRGWLVPRT